MRYHMIADPRHLRLNKKWFREWLDRNSISEDDNYKDHAVDVLEKWLDSRMSVPRIGNLFRFDDVQDYNSLKEMIVSSPSYDFVNGNDMKGRPNAALNHYEKYLAKFEKGELIRLLCEQIPLNGPRVIGGTFRRRG